MEHFKNIKVVAVILLAAIIVISYALNSWKEDKLIETKDGQFEDRDEEPAHRGNADSQKEKQSDSTPDPGRKVTIDGYDPATNEIIDPINLWANYRSRTYAGKLNHGEVVTMIRREGDGIYVEKASGLRGWVTYFFIKEFREEAKRRGDI